MHKLLIITKKEFYKTVSTKAFIITTIIGPFLIAALFFFQGMTSGYGGTPDAITTEKNIKIIGIDKELAEDTFEDPDVLKIKFIYSEESESVLRKQVLAGIISGFLVFPNIDSENKLLEHFKYTYYTKDRNPIASMIVQGVIGEQVVSARFNKRDIGLNDSKMILSHPSINSIKLSDKGEEGGGNAITIIFTISGFSMLLYMSIILYGQAIGRSVNMEKTSKTVEIMLSSAKPSDMMFGKIFGLGLGGLLQYAIWVTMGFVVLEVVFPLIGISATSFNVQVAHLFFLVLFFILGFLLYSGVFAALGSIAKDSQNLNQLSLPITMFLIVAIFSVNTISTNPDSLFIKILSYFPLTSPIIMLGRTLVGVPPVIEIIISITIIILSTIGLGFLASKIFRVGILMTGKKFKLSEVLKWLRYK